MSEPRVWLKDVNRDVSSIKSALSEMLAFCGISCPANTLVVVKPNFTWPGWKPGVTTHPVLLRALAEFFVDHGNEVHFVESDGGMRSWAVEEAFAGHDLYSLERQFGGRVRCRSLMKEPVSYLRVFCWGKYSRIPVPKFLLEEDKFYITVPVLKTHCMTETSLAFKNQWGCVPDTYRLRFHHVLGPAVVRMAEVFNVDLAVIDGLIALDGNGPMFGDPVEMNLLIGGGDPGAVSRVGCEVMGLRWWKSRVLRAAARRGRLPAMSSIVTSDNVGKYRTRRFVAKKRLPNYAAILIAYSRVATWFFYLSPFRPAIAAVKRALFGAQEITRDGRSCPY